ncbi:DUF1727 domain-containing protein [Berryella wangjianweii]|uniref:Multifunctional fusion protein n=1 Tax=Berryella wangjianweii TaxID=2734634 RepID=A0A6M8J0Q9_9ACTN|nr:MurT ligase domain-containing protein [Berryella wangjianweii]QKF07560.1 DUF1727 domain-containing protein [Berryella wangjianweii]
MNLRFSCARALSAVSTWVLKTAFHRPAANFPGKIALYADPLLLQHLRARLSESSVLVVGTNGKTTCTNLVADALEAQGFAVACNRTGANLDSGVATTLLQAKRADWGVFETDELWMARILPHLRSRYVLLLNLFRDQLDRVGEIDHIQSSIVRALEKSPDTVLVYNADDPLCQAIAERCPNRTLAFGLTESMGAEQNTVTDARMCQRCSGMLSYEFHQYGQLGSYACPACGFARPQLDFWASEVEATSEGLSFSLHAKGRVHPVRAPFPGAYMVYNLLAVATLSGLLGVTSASLDTAIQNFDPQNGRLQRYRLGGTDLLMNLAKNPTGFNQNLRLIAQEEAARKVAAFFVNDREGDGRDISWLWDIDFQELVDAGLACAFVGGMRANDLQVRLKYAGISAKVVSSATEVLSGARACCPDASVYLIANYTALPEVKAEVDALAVLSEDELDKVLACDRSCDARHAEDGDGAASADGMAGEAAGGCASAAQVQGVAADEPPVVIVHAYPDLLNLYGDGGNVTVLERRLRQRGIPVRVVRVEHGEQLSLDNADLVFLGGGPDREQRLAAEALMGQRDRLQRFVDEDGVVLAICGGYQMLGRVWLMGDEQVPGLGLVDIETRRATGDSRNRLIGDVVADCTDPAVGVLVGYENHAGRTYLGAGLSALGQVRGRVGFGNNGDDRTDGVMSGGVFGTYLHGPVLPKNPRFADLLLTRALERHARRCGRPAPILKPLDDREELAAQRFMLERLKTAGS